MALSLAAALAMAAAVFTGIRAIGGISRGRRRILARAHRAAALGPPPPPIARPSLLRADNLSDSAFLRRILQRYPWSARRAAMLERADLPLTVSEYAAILLALGILGAAGGAVLSGLPPVGLLTGGGAVLGADLLCQRRARQRSARFDQQLPAALQLLATSLRSGFGIMEAIKTVARETDPPLAAEFGHIVDEGRLGGSFEDSMDRLVERIGSRDLRIVARALRTHRKVGGNLAEILEGVADTMRERARLRGHVQSLTAEQRFGGAIVGLLPLWVIAFFLLVDPAFISPLWETSPGRLILAAGLAMEAVAFLIMRRIVAIDV